MSDILSIEQRSGLRFNLVFNQACLHHPDFMSKAADSVKIRTQHDIGNESDANSITYDIQHDGEERQPTLGLRSK